MDTSVVDGTTGGDTYIVDGKPLCFAYSRAHVRAVKALTNGTSGHLDQISDQLVDELLESRVIMINEDHCQEEYGWLGCRVFDGDGALIGIIGDRCTQPAGWGTDHPMEGRCRLHGGAGIEKRAKARITNGRTSKVLRRRVKEKVQAYLDDPQPTDLSRELATQRALLDEMLEGVLDIGDPEVFANSIPRVMAQLDLIGRQVDRITKVEQRYALTAGQIEYVKGVMADVINLYIEDPHARERAANFLVSKLGASKAMLVAVSSAD
jgi:hypothetical protein